MAAHELNNWTEPCLIKSRLDTNAHKIGLLRYLSYIDDLFFLLMHMDFGFTMTSVRLLGIKLNLLQSSNKPGSGSGVSVRCPQGGPLSPLLSMDMACRPCDLM